MIKVVVFDLDSVLVRTKEILQGQSLEQAKPAHVLKLSEPYEENCQLIRDADLPRQIDLLLACGIKIYILSRGPKAYASTLIYLLRIGFHELIPANESTTDIYSKLLFIRQKEDVFEAEMLYIGEEKDHKNSALPLCLFQGVESMFGGEGSQVSHFQSLHKICSKAVDSDVGDSNLRAWVRYFRESYSARAEYTLSAPAGIIEKARALHLEPLEVKKALTPEPFHDWCSDEVSIKPFLSPTLLSITEYEQDENKRRSLLEMLKQIDFGPKSLRLPSVIEEFNTKDFSIELQSHFHFWDEIWDIQRLWGKIKDWRQSRGSGPQTEMHYLELVALVMSTGLYEKSQTTVLVPVPAHNFSESKPGQVSVRLTYRLGQLNKMSVIEALHKTETNEVVAKSNQKALPSEIILVDDQITNGIQVLQSLKALKKLGVNKVEIHTFSSTRFELVNSAKRREV